MIGIINTALRRKVFILAVTFSFFVYFYLSLLDRNISFTYSDSFQDEDLKSLRVIEVEITDIEASNYGYYFICDTEYGKSRISVYGSDEVSKTLWHLIGVRLELSLKGGLVLPERASNPRLFDMRKYLLSKGIRYTGVVDSNSTEIKDDLTEKYAGKKAGDNIRRRYLLLKRILVQNREAYIDRVFTNESKGIARGILFGDTSGIDEGLYKVFQTNGTAHILAASGLHVGILYNIYSKAKKKCGSGFFGKILDLSFLIFLFIYGTIALWSSSITRAILLIFIKMLSDKLARRFDMMTGVSVINVVMLVARPYLIFNIGFQMSFFCAYAICVIVPRLSGRIPKLLAAPLGIQVFLLPYMIRNFNVFSPIGILLNIPIVYLTSLYVPLGIFGFMVSSLTGDLESGQMESASSLFGLIESAEGDILTSLGKMIVWLEDIVYSGGKYVFMLKSPSLFLVALYMIVIIVLFSETIIVLRERSKGKKKTRAIIVLFFLTIIVISSKSIGYFDETPFDDASQVFIDVGQGDSVCLRWDHDLDIMIDGGGRKDYNVGEKILKPYLLKNGSSDIDLALTTHEHMDHFKGIEELSEIFPIKNTISSGKAGDDIETNRSDRYIEILWPIPQYRGSIDENYYSRIYMVHDCGIKTLITGDITEEGEKALLKEYGGTEKLKCHILKVAHHGSRFSSSIEFLKKTSPLVAVISVGKNNSYGHPAPETIEKLDSLGIITYRTDEDGAIGVIPNVKSKDEGNLGFVICTYKTRRFEEFEIC